MTDSYAQKMADDNQACAASDSDSSDSSTISWPEKIKADEFTLKFMDSSSDGDNDYDYTEEASYFEVKVLKGSHEREKCSGFEEWKTPSHSDAFFKRVVMQYEMFPDSMKTFLSGKCADKLRELSRLSERTFFIYLARSLIVTLNVDNPRVRVPRSLVFDACIISEDNPVVVLSVFVSDTKNMDMYNTFVARGVTNALRTWCTEDISITNRAVTIDDDIGAEIMRLWKYPGVFHIQSSLKMSRDKAEQAAIALLKSISVASSFPLLYPDKAVSDHVWFLTESEFQFLTNFIDLQGDSNSVNVEGDGLLLQTEICIRLKKRYSTALFVTSVNSCLQTLHSHIGDSYSSLDECPKVDDSKYELVITDAPIERKHTVEEKEKGPRNAIFIEVTKADTKSYKGQSLKEKILNRFGKKLSDLNIGEECAPVPLKCFQPKQQVVLYTYRPVAISGYTTERFSGKDTGIRYASPDCGVEVSPRTFPSKPSSTYYSKDSNGRSGKSRVSYQDASLSTIASFLIMYIWRIVFWAVSANLVRFSEM